MGPPVAHAFAAAGWHVSLFSRTRAAAGSLPAGCDQFEGDLFDERRVADAVAGADVVVHLAGLLHIVDADASLAGEYVRVNVDGTRRVVAAARQAGVTRLVLASTIAVYGPTEGRVADETTVAAPDSAYASSKLASEQVVLSEVRPDGAPLGVVLRLAAVYGARVKGNYERLVRALAAGRFVPVGSGTNRRTLVYERDAARAFVLAAEHPGAPGRIFNVTDGRIHTVAAITEAVCKALGRRPPGIVIPVAAARSAAVLIERICQTVGRRPPLSRRTLTKYLENVEVSGESLARDLGFSPQWDLDSGWRDAVQEMKRIGRV